MTFKPSQFGMVSLPASDSSPSSPVCFSRSCLASRKRVLKVPLGKELTLFSSGVSYSTWPETLRVWAEGGARAL